MLLKALMLKGGRGKEAKKGNLCHFDNESPEPGRRRKWYKLKVLFFSIYTNLSSKKRVRGSEWVRAKLKLIACFWNINEFRRLNFCGFPMKKMRRRRHHHGSMFERRKFFRSTSKRFQRLLLLMMMEKSNHSRHINSTFISSENQAKVKLLCFVCMVEFTWKSFTFIFSFFTRIFVRVFLYEQRLTPRLVLNFEIHLNCDADSSSSIHIIHLTQVENQR